jgi:hypothetical protein
MSSWKLTSGLVGMLTISMAHPNGAWSQTKAALSNDIIAFALD